MPLRAIRTDAYLQDLLAIWDQKAKQSPDRADRIVGQIDGVVSRLEQFPDSGERFPHFGADCRRSLAGEYVIYYRRLDDQLRILRVYHTARQISSLSDP